MHTRVRAHTEGMGVEGEVKGRGGGGTREGKEVCAPGGQEETARVEWGWGWHQRGQIRTK